jgi:hypothetical protein
MDYVTRQFINLTKKLRKELRSALLLLNKSIEHQTEAIRKADNANKQGQRAPTSRAELYVPQSERYKQETKDTRQSIIEHWKLYAEIIGILVVVAYTTVSFLQLRELSKQYPELHTSAQAAESAAAINAEALHSVQRAFLTFPPSPVIDVFVNPGNESPLFQLTMPIENSGVTPARQMVDRVSCITPMGPLPTNYSFPDQKGDCGTPWAATGASFISAKSSVESQPVYVDFKFVKEFAEQAHGPWQGHIGRPDHPTRTISLYGWVVYRDIFEHTPEHLSEFCRTLIVLRIQQGKAQAAWGYCPMHNCTDKDCTDYEARIKAAHEAPQCCPKKWFKESN